VNQNRLLRRLARSPLFEAREDGPGPGHVVGVGGVKDHVELGGNLGEVGAVEVCDDGFDFCFCGEDVGAGSVADHGCDIEFLEGEEVVEDLAADVPGRAWIVSK
jgi:hypothetical protein